MMTLLEQLAKDALLAKADRTTNRKSRSFNRLTVAPLFSDYNENPESKYLVVGIDLNRTNGRRIVLNVKNKETEKVDSVVVESTFVGPQVKPNSEVKDFNLELPKV